MPRGRHGRPIGPRAAALAACALVGACRDYHAALDPGRTWPPLRLAYRNPIPAENALEGDPAWAAGPFATVQQLAAYGSRISAHAGQTVDVRVSSDVAASAEWSLYRLGWYGGAGARRLASGGPAAVSPQPECPMEAGTGLVRCAWTTSFSLTISSGMPSGLYGLKLIRSDGLARFVPLVVTDGRPADVLFQASVQTYEAYNAYGGESLYVDGSGTIPGRMAPKVSFNRPFDGATGISQMLSWEAPMAAFLERAGYDVSYVTNLDVASGGAPILDRAGIFLTVGHDEYWAGEERDAIEQARDFGVPLAFFSANTGYWKIRYEDFDGADNPRTMVCFKAGNDPRGADASGLFRRPGVHRPENGLLGVMYEATVLSPFAWVVRDPSSWLYEGTGLAAGDAIPGLVGYEFDHRVENGAQPDRLELLARSPVVTNAGVPSVSESIAYEWPSGSRVFAAGTIYWARALDPHGVPDDRVGRMTANVLRRALSLPIPAGLLSTAAPPGTAASMGPVPAVVQTVARGLDGAAGIAVMPGSGTVVIAIPRTPRILAVEPATGAVSVLAGDGTTSGNPRDDGVPGLQARFEAPVAVAADAAGRVYVADSAVHVIRRIDSDAAHTTTTFAGKLTEAGSGDGAGPAARFRAPAGLAVDAASSTLYVADTGNHRVRAIDLATGVVTTVAGSANGDVDGPGASARFSSPTALATAPDGRIFVLCSGSRRIKVIQTDPARSVVTLAGSAEGFADGAGNAARLWPQGGLGWSGNFLVISDGSNLRIRALVPGSKSSNSRVYTLAGSGRFGWDDGPAATATVGLPLGVAVAADGSVYFADSANGALRVIRFTP